MAAENVKQQHRATLLERRTTSGQDKTRSTVGRRRTRKQTRDNAMPGGGSSR